MNFFSRLLALGVAVSSVALPARAQTLDPVPDGVTNNFNADDDGPPLAPLGATAPNTDVSHTALDVATQTALDQAQTRLDNRDPTALSLARQTALNTLKALSAATGGNALDRPTLPDDPLSVRLAMDAVQAHALWGRAADFFGQRDEAITALIRAKTLIAALPVAPDGTTARDVNLELNSLLRGGLPLIAPDDVLAGIASGPHENLWRPQRFDFAPAPSSTLDAPPKTALLITQGELFPPAQRGQSLVQIPPFYRPSPSLGPDETQTALDRLPSSLKLNRMVAGYSRVSSGPNSGQWRQTVRVFYASPFLTKDKRDDATRAQALASAFLRVHALYESQLGATNLYTRGPLDEGVTTLYLLEVSALWPQDDDDPVVLATMGPKMPPVNTGPRPSSLQAQPTPLMRPWMPIAGQNEAAPGEIMFWKAGLSRSEGEWTRELFHEYGHVALPPFGGFRPPLEPYGNGLLGETLGMMWAAQTPDALADNGSRADFLLHVSRQAVPARLAFLSDDPNVPHLSGTAADLRFLQGMVVVCERVYGAPMLGRAFAPLAQSGANAQNVAARRSLLSASNLQESLGVTMRQTFAARRAVPVYLPAALDVALDAAALAVRAPVRLKAGSRVTGWVFVPSGANSLNIESPNLSAIGLPWKREIGATRVYFGGKSGWQRLSLVAQGDTVLDGARFE